MQLLIIQALRQLIGLSLSYFSCKNASETNKKISSGWRQLHFNNHVLPIFFKCYGQNMIKA